MFGSRVLGLRGGLLLLLNIYCYGDGSISKPRHRHFGQETTPNKGKGPIFLRRWPVPVITRKLRDRTESSQLLHSLRETVLELAGSSAGVNRTNRGGWQSGGIHNSSQKQDLLERDDRHTRCAPVTIPNLKNPDPDPLHIHQQVTPVLHRQTRAAVGNSYRVDGTA